ncbi:MAG: PfkB family carbohydrate kinase [Acidobacteriota bacterium]
MGMIRNIEWDVVVIGSANTDYLGHGPKLPTPGSSVEGDIFQQATGGKGANQAIAAARLGAKVALIARVGNDSGGNNLLDQLAIEGVDKRYVIRDAQIPTGIALIMVGEKGEKQTLFFPGANSNLAIEDVNAAKGMLESARVVGADRRAGGDSFYRNQDR